jgi:hypothetical protein
MPFAVYTLPVVGIHHLLAHQWLSSFVCRFLIELCGLCLKLSKLYNVLDVDKSIICVGDFTSGIFGWNYLSHFWKIGPFHSISVSLTVTLQTFIWLLISPSWLLLIIHGIGNLTQSLVHWLSRTYQGDFKRLYSFYQRTIAKNTGD